MSASSVIDDAELAVARAQAADGEKYALYDTTLADLFLIKAREEQGHAHYGDAEELAELALLHAKDAQKKSAERRTAGATAPPLPTATIQRPVTQPAAPAPTIVHPLGPAPIVVPAPEMATPAPAPGSRPDHAPIPVDELPQGPAPATGMGATPEAQTPSPSAAPQPQAPAQKPDPKP